jgi:trypsin
MKVRAGSTNSLEGGSVVSVSEVIIHPDYVMEPREADIAILVMSEYLALSATIRVIYIPPQQTDIPDGYPVKSLSWGFDSVS